MVEDLTPIPQDVAYGLPSVEILRGKTDAFISSLWRSFDHGYIKPQRIRDLKLTAPRTHDDILMVYLGLRPLAWDLAFEVRENPAFHYVNHSIERYAHAFPTQKNGGTDLMYANSDVIVDDVLTIWSPDAVRTTIAKNPDIFGADFPDPATNEFASLFTSFQFPPSDRILGTLLGIPRADVESFAQHVPQLLTIIDQYPAAALFSQLPEHGSPLSQLVSNTGDVRRKLLALCASGRLPVGSDLVSYITKVHGANVPGFQYVTVSEDTAYEDALRDAWEKSQIDDKLEGLLLKYHV